MRIATLPFIINHDTFFRLSIFSDLNISQGSVATRLRCCGILNIDFFCKFISESNSARIWKIG